MRTLANCIVPAIAIGLLLGNGTACGGEVISIGTDVAGTGGSGSGSSGAAGSAPIDTSHVDEVCAGFVAASALTSQCCSPAEQNDLAITIVSGVGNVCQDLFTQSITKGRVVIDPDALAQCQSPTLACTSFTSGFDLPICSAAVHGTGVEGDTCELRMECSAGLTCIGHSETTSGTCAPPPKLGEKCYPRESGLEPVFLLDSLFADDNPLCASGARCANYSFGGTGTCIPLPGLGDVCSSSEGCQLGLSCSLEKCTSKPAPPAVVGGACKDDDDCKTGLTCSDDECIEPMPAGSPCKYPSGHPCLGRCEEPASGDDSICVSFCGSG